MIIQLNFTILQLKFNGILLEKHSTLIDQVTKPNFSKEKTTMNNINRLESEFNLKVRTTMRKKKIVNKICYLQKNIYN